MYHQTQYKRVCNIIFKFRYLHARMGTFCRNGPPPLTPFLLSFSFVVCFRCFLFCCPPFSLVYPWGVISLPCFGGRRLFLELVLVLPVT